ncbi:LytR C-terminal domain-containing protein [Streptomyces sp. TRM 70351]|uniref:LytR C-terminal domain-containing protein n=1 Tax=Streptomyces sp. TRM 70351 TaxID=3116552 RepID=UPI002E7B268C|nr:LytR C-terminal domain-containing protein [Streptomyces sp. TRM 70351]MEE1928407.1 LytR C-terminal domain-containing protein [Streptomyces sp. TRM 70351]
MNDRQDPYGHQEFAGYDEYGRPVYHDPYARQHEPDPWEPRPSEQQFHEQPQQYGAQQYEARSYGAQSYEPQSYEPTAYEPQRYEPQPYGQTGYAGPSYGQGYPGPTHGQGDAGPSPYGQQPYGDGHPRTEQPSHVPPDHGPGSADGRPGQASWVPQQPGPPYGSAEYVPPGYGHDGPQTYGYPEPETEPGREPESGAAPEPGTASGGAEEDRAGEGEEYRTEEFSFIEEKDEESEDVVDWLKFSESRTERREGAKRRGRNRTVALVVAAVLLVAGGTGYLWSAGLLPGTGAEESGPAASAAERRNVVVVHLREIDGGNVSTALLVNNETAGSGTTVLLPNSLALTADDGTTTTLGASFDAQGAGATRDALGVLLGADIKGTWRLDTPYLENLVESVGGITLDADATVPGPGKDGPPLVAEGAGRELNGQAAVAYATHRAEKEPQSAQLTRFGQVMEAALRELSSDASGAIRTVQSLGQIPDPSLSDAQLGTALAELAARAQQQKLDTRLLPVEDDGTLSDETARGLVRDVLGGTVSDTDSGAAVRVSVRDATGSAGSAETAQVALVNGGYTVVPTREADATAASSTVTYADEADAARAVEVAKTLGLPEESVERGEGAANADVTVVLGTDYGGATG